MAAPFEKSSAGPVGQGAAFALSAYALSALPAAQIGPDTSPLAYYGLLGFAGLTGIKYGVHVLRAASQSWHYARALRGEKVKGRAAWLTRSEARKAGLMKAKGGLPSGLLSGEPIFAHTETHSLVNGPAGSGKTVSFCIPMLCHCPHAMLVMDPKKTLWEATASVRAGRLGQRAVLLCPNDRKNSEQLNPLDLIGEKLERDSPDALVVAEEYAYQLHPEPEGDSGQNLFFRIGSRRVLATLFVVVCAVYPPEKATLTFVYEHLTNEALLNETLILAQEFMSLGGDVAAKARDLHEMAFEDGGARTYIQFKLGALNSLAPWSPGSDLAWVSARSTVSIKSLKDADQPETWYVATSPNHQKAYAPWIGLLFVQAAYELVEVRNSVPVQWLCEELNNSPVYTLPKILTLLREYGVRVTMIVQDIEDIARVYGLPALKTIMSEASLKFFLGGVRSQETAELIVKMLGDAERVSRSYGLGDDVRPSTQLEAAPLLRPDEVRTLDPGFMLAFIHHLKPALLEKVSVAESRPWAYEVTPSSMHGGKRFVRPWKLTLSYGRRILTSGRSRAARPDTARQGFWQSGWGRRVKIASFFASQSKAIPAALIAGAIIWGAQTYGLPQILTRYGGGFCAYAGLPEGHVRQADHCPFIAFHRSQ